MNQNSFFSKKRIRFDKIENSIKKQKSLETYMEELNLISSMDEEYSYLLDEFPDEILIHILGYLTCSELAIVSQLSYAWPRRASSNSLYKAIVASYYNISVDQFCSDEDNWKEVLKEIYSKIIRNPNYSWPKKLGRRNYDPYIQITDDSLSATFCGSIGNNQVVFGDAPFRLTQQSSPYIGLQAFYLQSDTETTKSFDLKSSSKFKPVYYRIVRGYLGYFEITISKGLKNTEKSNHRLPCVAIGLALDSFPTTRFLPGWKKNSYGYHSDDGKIFRITEKQYGKTFGSGDTVGIGIDFKKEEIFFTLNGEYLGLAFENVRESELFPVVGIDSNDIITFNFGALPFAYDITKNRISKEDLSNL